MAPYSIVPQCGGKQGATFVVMLFPTLGRISLHISMLGVGEFVARLTKKYSNANMRSSKLLLLSEAQIRDLCNSDGGVEMPNLSKVNDPRFWERWRASGAVASLVDERPKRQLRTTASIPRSDRSHSDELAGFGMLIGALFGGGSDVGSPFPRSDAEDFKRGARFVPGEVTLARRHGETVRFITTCASSNCWYWQMADGSRIYHFDEVVHDFLKARGNRCPQCGNTHISGGTVSAAELQVI